MSDLEAMVAGELRQAGAVSAGVRWRALPLAAFVALLFDLLCCCQLGFLFIHGVRKTRVFVPYVPDHLHLRPSALPVAWFAGSPSLQRPGSLEGLLPPDIAALVNLNFTQAAEACGTLLSSPTATCPDSCATWVQSELGHPCIYLWVGCQLRVCKPARQLQSGPPAPAGYRTLLAPQFTSAHFALWPAAPTACSCLILHALSWTRILRCAQCAAWTSASAAAQCAGKPTLSW